MSCPTTEWERRHASSPAQRMGPDRVQFDPGPSNRVTMFQLFLKHDVRSVAEGDTTKKYDIRRCICPLGIAVKMALDQVRHFGLHGHSRMKSHSCMYNLELHKIGQHIEKAEAGAKRSGLPIAERGVGMVAGEEKGAISTMG